MMFLGLGAVTEGQVQVAPTLPWEAQPAPPMPATPVAAPTPWYFQWYVLIPVLLGGVYFYKRHKRSEPQP